MLERPVEHLWSLGQGRERAALERWMFGNCREVLHVLGLPDGWWCGLFLGRHAIFGDGASGDIDLIAGPLEYRFSHLDWEERVRTEEARYPDMPRQFAVASAHAVAGRDGCVDWPPRVAFVVGCEVKASYYNGYWKRTHVSPSSDIPGQLTYLGLKGVNRVSLVHLGALRPADEPVHFCMAAAAELDRAVPVFPMPAVPRGYGHYFGAMAAVPDLAEDRAGAHVGLREVAAPAWLAPRLPCPWRSRLEAKLGELPQPPYFRTFILECTACKAWRISGATGSLIGPPCQCHVASPPNGES